jgi:hypothetical protein
MLSLVPNYCTPETSLGPAIFPLNVRNRDKLLGHVSSVRQQSHSSERHSRLPHRRCPRLLFTTLRDDDNHRAEHALSRHPPTFRHLPRRTRAGRAGRSRPEASHADGVSRSYDGGRWRDTRREGTGRGGERACERGAHGGTAESEEEGDAWLDRRLGLGDWWVCACLCRGETLTSISRSLRTLMFGSHRPTVVLLLLRLSLSRASQRIGLLK